MHYGGKPRVSRMRCQWGPLQYLLPITRNSAELVQSFRFLYRQPISHWSPNLAPEFPGDDGVWKIVHSIREERLQEINLTTDTLWPFWQRNDSGQNWTFSHTCLCRQTVLSSACSRLTFYCESDDISASNVELHFHTRRSFYWLCTKHYPWRHLV